MPTSDLYAQMSGPMTPPSPNITRLLLDWRNGDQSALDRLMPLVYEELRRMANHYMRNERRGHTLQTSALVNEAYLRLVDHENIEWQNRAQDRKSTRLNSSHLGISYAVFCLKNDTSTSEIYTLSLHDALPI